MCMGDSIEIGGVTYTAPPKEQEQIFQPNPHKVYYGDEAVMKVHSREGHTTPTMNYIIHHEGFVDGDYDDTKGIKTRGVGQTGEYMNMTFKESYFAHEDKAAAIIPSFHQQHPSTQKALMSLIYRGDMKSSHQWVKDFNNGEYEKAAVELLDHKEYKDLVEKGEPSGIIKRLEEASELIRNTKT